MRKCQKNTCPAGIATQDPELRKNFVGTPEKLINFFYFVAEEVRTIMAQLGVAQFEDLIGHSEYLQQRDPAEISAHFDKARTLSLTPIFFQEPVECASARHHSTAQDHELEHSFDFAYLDDLNRAFNAQQPLKIESTVCNINRAVGTLLGAHLTQLKQQHKQAVTDNFVTLQLHGTAGQSLGAFLTQGITLELEGEGNDYVGKGLSGGVIAIKKDRAFDGKAEHNIIAGNTCLYGATSGKAFFNGCVGERFAVRNSGASCVVEGTGEHGCEYMTNGTVVVLGSIGSNFAAGMSGGVAYLYDPQGEAKERLAQGNFILSYVKPQSEDSLDLPLHQGKHDETLLHELIAEHVAYTGSTLGQYLLEHFDECRGKFLKIMPHEYAQALKTQSASAH